MMGSIFDFVNMFNNHDYGAQSMGELVGLEPAECFAVNDVPRAFDFGANHLRTNHLRFRPVNTVVVGVLEYAASLSILITLQMILQGRRTDIG